MNVLLLQRLPRKVISDVFLFRSSAQVIVSFALYHPSLIIVVHHRVKVRGRHRTVRKQLCRQCACKERLGTDSIAGIKAGLTIIGGDAGINPVGTYKSIIVVIIHVQYRRSGKCNSRKGISLISTCGIITGYLHHDIVQRGSRRECGVTVLTCPPLAEHALKDIQELYRIEHMADQKELSYQTRADLRQKLATPIFESLEKWMEQTYSQVPPKSRTGQAIAYALWPRMKRYLQDGRIKIDNNLAENAIRPLTISRKNFLFCGNHKAAENTAIICSLLATCKTQEVNPREWLNDVIAQLPAYLEKGSGKELKELLPNVWNAKKSNEDPM